MKPSSSGSNFNKTQDSSKKQSALSCWLMLMRPRQWIKNLILFAGLLFTGNFENSLLLFKSFSAFLVFCVLSSVGYIINDVMDVKRDQLHPIKCKRPIASGMIKPFKAVLVAIILGLCAMIGAYLLNSNFFYVCIAYLAFTVVYTLVLKHMVILDVLAIAAGFVLRALAGAVVINVYTSPWLLVCVSLLALLLGFGKRRYEINLLASGAKLHRPVLNSYSSAFLDQAMSMTSSSAIVTYAIYSVTSDTAHKHPMIILTIPIVLYSILRYSYLIFHESLGGQPEELFLKDKPLMASVIVWAVTVMVIFALNR